MPLFRRKKQDASEDEWVVDSVVGYLTSPVFAAPIADFIDLNCAIFHGSTEEHAIEETLVFERYQALVEQLLESFLQDLGMTPLQLAKIVAEAETSQRPRFSPEIFMHVSAADDFLLFKHMMVAQNLQLEMEVRSQLQPVAASANDPAQNQSESMAPLPNSANLPPPAEEDDAAIINQLLRLSLEEYQAAQNRLADGDQDLMAALEASRQEHEKSQQLARLEAEQLAAALKASMEPSPAAAAAQPPAVREQQASQPVQPKTTVNPAATTLPALPSTISSLRDLPPLPSPTRKMPVPPTSLPTASQSALVYLASEQKAAAAGASIASATTPQHVAADSEAAIEARRQHLREQRERLLQRRQQERSAQLEQYLKQQPQAQPEAGAGAGAGAGTFADASRPSSQTGSKTVNSRPGSSSRNASKGDGSQMRKALASHIRREISHMPVSP